MASSPSKIMVSLPPDAQSAHASAVAAGVLLAVIGWTWLGWMIFNTLPTVPNRWLFYLLFQVALSGTALPFVRYLHQRFDKPDAPPVSYIVLVRQSIWVGLFGVACLWLRIPRLLSIPAMLVVAVAFVAIEFFLRLRERTQWRPE